MNFNTNSFRRTAAGVGLVLAALAFPAAAQAATTQTSAATASNTPQLYGIYSTSDACLRAAAEYTAAGKSAVCRPSSIYARPPLWMLYVS
ncbi:hypothetical protein [Microbispora amethystogenes]|uniref:Uncharacterized protein n=1 Tax=Microbispora amethystogenes TaxID=1427754 RepID=A0ABQ4FNZ3_9ACTN|nr:hypothetical protein [Microbispora amethystogenes]GIH36539.1 hypothetical protein Mam01_67030 [Microbispora amethystogenes]